MGLDAYVRCKCPPDEECEHEAHWYVDVRVGNWFTCAAFQEAVEALGRTRFPTLDGLLPDGNYGGVEADEAATAQVELDVFMAAPEIGRRTDLYDGEGTCRYPGSPAAGGAFHFDRGVRVGFDEDGLFVVGRTGPAVPRLSELAAGPAPGGRVRLGRRVRQEVLPDGRARLVAADDPAVACELPSPVLDGVPVLETREAVAVPADHADLVDALRRVFAAAVALDEPVIWI